MRRPLNVRCDPYGESLKMKSIIAASYTSFAACVARFSDRIAAFVRWVGVLRVMGMLRELAIQGLRFMRPLKSEKTNSDAPMTQVKTAQPKTSRSAKIESS